MSEQNNEFKSVELENPALTESSTSSAAPQSEDHPKDLPTASGTHKKPRKKLKKGLVIPLVVLLIIGAAGISKMLNGSNAQQLTASTYTLEEGAIEQRITASGVVKGSDSAEIGTMLNYEFVAINVKEGDIVQKGDILGVLDNKTLKSDYDMALQDLEMTKKQLDEQYRSAQLALEERQVDYNEAKRQSEIAKQLYDEGGISNDELVQANLAFERATFALNAAKDSLQRASSSGSSALALTTKQELLETKKDNLDKANITTPISGTVTRVNAKLGRIPSAQDQVKALFIVENPDDLLINVNISEFDISKIQVGQVVSITSDVLEYGTSIEGVVSRIAPTGESVQSSTSREMRIPVEIKITTKDSRILAGVNAKADILVAKKEQVLSVPLEAILEEDGNKFVLLGNDNVIKKIPVETGLEGIARVEITSSELKAGDIILLNPTAEMTEGSSYKTAE